MVLVSSLYGSLVPLLAHISADGDVAAEPVKEVFT